MATDLLLKIGSDVKGFVDGISETKASITGATSEIEGKLGFLDGLSDKLGGVWGGLALGAGAAALGAGAALLKIGGDFDSMYDKIRIGTGATGEALAGLGDSAKNVFANVPSSIDDVSLAIADLNTRTGATGPVLEDLATKSLNLARITETDLAGNIVATTAAFNNWQIATGEQGNSLDYLFKVSQSTGVGISTLSKTVGDLGPLARGVGLDFETTAALVGKFNLEGVSTQTITSGLNIALKKMAEEGVTNASQELQALITDIKGAGTEAGGNAIAVAAFGRSGIGMADAIRQGNLEVGGFVDQLKNSPETINKAADDTADLAEAFTTFKNSVMVAAEPLATNLFNALNEYAIPALQATGTAIKEVIDWFSGWDLSAWTTTHFGPFLAAIQPITDGLQNVWSALGPLVSAFGEFAGKLAILGIGAVAEHFRQLWNAIEPIASAVGRAAAAFTGWALDRFAQFVRDSTTAFTDLIGILNKIPGVAGVFDGLKTKVDASATSTKDAKEEATKHGDAVKKSGDAHTTATGKINTHTTGLGKNKDAAKEAAKEQKILDDALAAFGITSDGANSKTEKLWGQLRILEQAAKDGKIPIETVQEAIRKLHEESDKENLKLYADKMRLVGIDAGGPGGAAEKVAKVQEALDLVKKECGLGIRPWEDYEFAAANAKTTIADLTTHSTNMMNAFKLMTTEVNNAKPPLDLLGTTASATRDYLAGVAMSTTDATTAAVNAAAPTWGLEAAYKQLGITSSQALADKAEAARIAYEAIVNSSAPAIDKMNAYKAAVKAAEDAAKPFGDANVGALQSIFDKGLAVLSGPGSLSDKWESFQKNAKDWTTSLATHAIDKLFNKSKSDSWHAQGITGIAGVETAFGAFKTNLIDAAGGLAGSLTAKLFEGKGSWRDIGEQALGALVSAFGTMATNWITSATGLRDSLNSIFSAIKPPNLGSLGSIGGGGGSTSGGGPVDTSGISGAVNSGIASIIGAVGSVTGAISGIIGNFQNAKQETTLNAIEENTRDTESEVRNLRDDEWTREGHLMLKLDDVWNAVLALGSWDAPVIHKLDSIWGTLLGGAVVGGGGDTGTAALQSIETSSTGTNDHLSAFRTEVSTGFFNAAVQGDSVLGELRTIAGNTEPTPSGAMSVVAPNVEEGLRNINLTSQGVYNALSPLKDIKDTLGAMRNNIGVISGIKEAIVGQLGNVALVLTDTVSMHLAEMRGLLRPQYLFYDRIEQAIAARQKAGGTVEVNIEQISFGSNVTLNRDTISAFGRTIGDQVMRSLALQGTS